MALRLQSTSHADQHFFEVPGLGDVSNRNLAFFSVHPGLLWVEAEATAVEEDGCFEVLTVSEATDSSLDGHDFAVHAFGDGVRDSVSAIAHDILQTFLDGSCDGLHWLEFCVNHSLVPVVEISCR